MLCCKIGNLVDHGTLLWTRVREVKDSNVYGSTWAPAHGDNHGSANLEFCDLRNRQMTKTRAYDDANTASGWTEVRLYSPMAP